jgi:hypothetical protein
MSPSLLSPANEETERRRGSGTGFFQIIEYRIAYAAHDGSIAVHHHEPIDHRFQIGTYNFVAGERHFEEAIGRGRQRTVASQERRYCPAPKLSSAPLRRGGTGLSKLKAEPELYSGVPVSLEIRRFDPRGKLVSEQSAKSLGVSRRPRRFSRHPMQSFPAPRGLALSQR